MNFAQSREIIPPCNYRSSADLTRLGIRLQPDLLRKMEGRKGGSFDADATREERD